MTAPNSGKKAGVLLEALVLYLVLFPPRIPYPEILSPSAPLSVFSLKEELVKLFFYTVPALALTGALLHKKDFSFFSRKGARFQHSAYTSPGKKALRRVVRESASLCMTFPCLALIGWGVSALSGLFDPRCQPPRLEAPSSLAGRAVLVISALGTGYVEELFFRRYLPARFGEAGADAARAGLFSTLLFALSHTYAGPWSVLNAALSGAFLSVMMLKRQSLHGIAAAHGGYNVFVWLSGET
ncbi:MAG: CPBP family intramembrane metalloprotease [Spirochaetaceae bacterium]|jgi:membrane protease YdiL (CAAX protease family)|nr:CPBP family intramembrane metalloprotease [Spirochaetaceae bacterium]